MSRRDEETEELGPPGTGRTQDLRRAEREAELEALEAEVDGYLGGEEEPLDAAWWAWFASLETEGRYQFGLSEQWLRWFESLDRAA